MKLIRISKNGMNDVYARAVTSADGQKYYCVTHGQQGRGRWEVRFPLPPKDFPVTDEKIKLEGEFRLVDLKRQDRKGNTLYLLTRGKDDGKYLVFWHLSPGFRGGASYEVQGQAKVIALGEEAQGEAGRMGGADCPVVLVEGPCQLTWHRTGRLYGEEPDWSAVFDGKQWTVAPSDKCFLEQAVFTYEETETDKPHISRKA